MPLPYLYSMQVLLLYFLYFIFCKFLLTQYIFFIVFKEIYIDTCSKLDQLTIINDFLFKKVMQNKRICKHLIEEILHIQIETLTFIELEKTIMAATVSAWMSRHTMNITRCTILKCRLRMSLMKTQACRYYPNAHDITKPC